jgi:hypothetical protein
MNSETDIIKRSTVTQMVAAWRESEAEVRQALGALRAARDRMRDAFADTDGYKFDWRTSDQRDSMDIDDPDGTMTYAKKQAWAILVEKMGIRRIMSIKRCSEMDKQLQTGDGMPEITETNVLAMMEQNLNSAPQMIEEAVREVFDYLRPGTTYKTNAEFHVGKRVVLSYAVEGKWKGGFEVRYARRDQLRALDNAFHALDGKGTVHTHNGPLYDAIYATTSDRNTGETEYFRFRCFRNHNLHIEFRRLDLVDRLNAVAGGMRLRPADLRPGGAM